MTNSQPRTNAQEIESIKNEVITKYLTSYHTGLIDSDALFLSRAERAIEKLKESGSFSAIDYACYYAAKAIIATAKGDLHKAEQLYLKAIKLSPNNLDSLSNYNNILLGAGRFSEAQEYIENYLAKGGQKYEFLFNLYICSLRNLEFSSFLEHYEKIRNKDVLSVDSKRELEKFFVFSQQLNRMKKDLEAIDIDVATYSEFFDVLYNFHEKTFYDPLYLSFSIENGEDQYIAIDVFVDVTISESLIITSKFENTLVNYAVDSGRDDILSKFLVYYKSLDTLSDESHVKGSIYLGMNEEWIV